MLRIHARSLGSTQRLHAADRSRTVDFEKELCRSWPSTVSQGNGSHARQATQNCLCKIRPREQSSPRARQRLHSDVLARQSPELLVEVEVEGQLLQVIR